MVCQPLKNCCNYVIELIVDACITVMMSCLNTYCSWFRLSSMRLTSTVPLSSSSWHVPSGISIWDTSSSGFWGTDLFTHPPLVSRGGIYFNHFVHLSVCNSVSVSNHVCWISPESLNHFFLTKFGMGVYYHEVMCHVNKLVHYIQCQCESLYNQNQTIFTISSTLLVHLQPNMVWWYSIISQSVLWENGITVLKVKATAKVQNVCECLSGQYPLNHRTFFHHTRYGYAALLAKVSCRKIASLCSMSRSQRGLM